MCVEMKKRRKGGKGKKKGDRAEREEGRGKKRGEGAQKYKKESGRERNGRRKEEAKKEEKKGVVVSPKRCLCLGSESVLLLFRCSHWRRHQWPGRTAGSPSQRLLICTVQIPPKASPCSWKVVLCPNVQILMLFLL